jgi:hypothetical protein
MAKRIVALLMVTALVPAVAVLHGEPPSPDRHGIARDEAGSRPTSRPATRPGPRRGGPALSEDQERELLSVLKDKQPGHYQRLVELRDSHPRRYRWALLSAWRWYRRWRAMPEDIREAANAAQNAKIMIYRTLQELREADDDYARFRLRRELRHAVRQEFEAELVVREYRLAQLEAELERLRAELEQREQNADALIAERVEHHLRVSGQPTTNPAEGAASAEPQPGE